MKALIVTNHSYMLWQFRRELIAELLKRSEVLISTPFVGHENDFEEMGCRVIETRFNRRSINPFSDLRLVCYYYRLMKKEYPDFVITYSIKPNIYAGFVCRMLRIPYYTNVQGLGTMFQNRLTAIIASILYRAGIKKASKVFFENSANADEFIRRKIVSPENVVLLSGAGVNLSVFKQQPYPDEDNGIRFLYLGRIMKEKGMDEFFSAARSLKGKYGNGVYFDVVGFFEDEYKETVETLVKEGIICFHGFQSDPCPWYIQSHCVVLPSYHEGMSNVLLEGGATGRPLITSDIPGCREAVVDGISGFLCRKMDAISLEECMCRFMSMTEDERREMGRQSRVKIENDFDRRQTVEKLMDIILD